MHSKCFFLLYRYITTDGVDIIFFHSTTRAGRRAIGIRPTVREWGHSAGTPSAISETTDDHRTGLSNTRLINTLLPLGYPSTPAVLCGTPAFSDPPPVPLQYPQQRGEPPGAGPLGAGVPPPAAEPQSDAAHQCWERRAKSHYQRQQPHP